MEAIFDDVPCVCVSCHPSWVVMGIGSLNGSNKLTLSDGDSTACHTSACASQPVVLMSAIARFLVALYFKE